MKYEHVEYISIFKALADATRLKIIDMLSNGELCAYEILENLDITQPTLSYHMKILCDNGLVEGRRDGALMKYSLRREKLKTVREVFVNIIASKS